MCYLLHLESPLPFLYLKYLFSCFKTKLIHPLFWEAFPDPHRQKFSVPSSELPFYLFPNSTKHIFYYFEFIPQVMSQSAFSTHHSSSNRMSEWAHSGWRLEKEIVLGLLFFPWETGLMWACLHFWERVRCKPGSVHSHAATVRKTLPGMDPKQRKTPSCYGDIWAPRCSCAWSQTWLKIYCYVRHFLFLPSYFEHGFSHLFQAKIKKKILLSLKNTEVRIPLKRKKSLKTYMPCLKIKV